MYNAVEISSGINSHVQLCVGNKNTKINHVSLHLKLNTNSKVCSSARLKINHVPVLLRILISAVYQYLLFEYDRTSHQTADTNTTYMYSKSLYIVTYVT